MTNNHKTKEEPLPVEVTVIERTSPHKGDPSSSEYGVKALRVEIPRRFGIERWRVDLSNRVRDYTSGTLRVITDDSLFKQLRGRARLDEESRVVGVPWSKIVGQGVEDRALRKQLNLNLRPV